MASDEPPLRTWLGRLEATPTNRMLAAIGYIPFLCFLPIFARRDDEFARLHGKQSLVLLAALIGIWILIWLVDLLIGGILGHIFIIGVLFKLIAWLVHYVLGGTVSLAYFIAIIAGALQAIAGKEWRIPVIAPLAQELRL